MKRPTLMAGLSLLEIMIACAILSGSTLIMLWLLLQQRVSIDQMRDRVLTMQVLAALSDQLRVIHCASLRHMVVQDWQRMTQQMFPYQQVDFYCSRTRCRLCVINRNHSGEKLCATPAIVDSPCSS